MRTLVLTLMMSFLGQGVFGAGAAAPTSRTGGGAEAAVPQTEEGEHQLLTDARTVFAHFLVSGGSTFIRQTNGPTGLYMGPSEIPTALQYLLTHMPEYNFDTCLNLQERSLNSFETLTMEEDVEGFVNDSTQTQVIGETPAEISTSMFDQTTGTNAGSCAPLQETLNCRLSLEVNHTEIAADSVTTANEAYVKIDKDTGSNNQFLFLMSDVTNFILGHMKMMFIVMVHSAIDAHKKNFDDSNIKIPELFAYIAQEVGAVDCEIFGISFKIAVLENTSAAAVPALESARFTALTSQQKGVVTDIIAQAKYGMKNLVESLETYELISPLGAQLLS